MFEKLKSIFRKKSKPKKENKINKEEVIVLTDNNAEKMVHEVKKSPVQKETKETKSSLTFGK